MVLVLGLAFGLASIEDHSNRLLAGGVVCGDVEQVAGATGLQTPKLVAQGLAGCPGEKCVDDIYVDDIRKGVASFGEPMDVILQGLAGLLLAALKVLEVTRADIRPLEISDEDPLEARPITDAVVREEFEPRPNMFPHADGQILNDENVIIHPFGSVGEPEIFEPNTKVRLSGVLGDVGGWLEAMWEWRPSNTPAKGPWSQALRARTPVV